MPLFSLKKIGELAANRSAYLRGVSLYNGDRVADFARSAAPEGGELLTAAVTDGDEVYAVEIGLSAAGAVTHLRCGCSLRRPDDRACCHAVAALVHKYYADMVRSHPIDTGAAGERLSAPAAPRHSDEAARRLLQKSLSRTAATMAAEAAAPAEPAQLIPTLEFHMGQARLSFSIGARRLYVLRDISRFCDDMAAGATTAYGKDFRLLHHLSHFAPASRPLVCFLQQEYADRQESGRAFNPYDNGRLGRHFPLTPGALDRFFDLMMGQELRIRSEHGLCTGRLLDEDPALSLDITAPEAGGGLYLRTADVLILRGGAHLYVLHGGALYRCSADYTRHMADWLETSQRAAAGLFVADADLPAFCTGLLPRLREHVRLQGDIDRLEACAPRRLEAEVYLDAPDADTVSAQVVCRYGEDRFDPYADNGDPAPFRDRLGELRVRLLLQTYFTSYLPGTGQLLFHGDADTLYAFMSTGIAEISKVATVYATDAFKRIGLLPPPRASVGVRLESDLLLDIDLGGLDPAEWGRILDSYHRKKKYHRLKSGGFIQLEEGALAALAEMADSLALTEQELRTGHIRAPKYRALYLNNLLREREIIPFRRDNAFRALVKNMKAVADNDFSPPASLAPILRPYQKMGFRWLKTLEAAGFGGILADDMGLGKTLQVISLFLSAKEEGDTRPSLVVCPASLVLNWEQEIRRFAPSLRTLTVIGDAETRADALSRAADFDVILTSYDLLKRDIDRYAHREFHYHILDEAQFIKNHATQNAKAVKAIRSAQRFALTGTPIENRLGELWSLFDFLMPGFLYPYSRFRERLELPIVRGGDERALTRLNRMVAPFILRRLKKDVLRDLPPKTERTLYTDMEPEQRLLYRANAAEARHTLEHTADEADRIAILALLTRLRQICCEPALCYENYTAGSGKLASCLELIREAADGGHKVLLFSQFTSMLEILEARLQEMGIACYLLRGSTPKERRAAMVEEFNRDNTPVFLISLKAGGTGLNLTGADMVIHYDPWWNLAAQEQATDRAYRIGQTQPVQVVKLITKDTVEEKILRLQESKQELADAVIRTGGSLLSALSKDDWLAILSE